MGGQMADDVISTVSLDLRVEDEHWLTSDTEQTLQELAETAFNAAAHATKSGHVDLLLTGDAQMQVLNRNWRDKDKPTDVLSFPSDDLAFESGILGDIALGFGVFTEDLTKLKREFNAHFSHLLIHGYLHLLGFDHENEADADEMEALETNILAELGYSDPYSTGA